MVAVEEVKPFNHQIKLLDLTSRPCHLQENNFKAVLESIRDLMNEDTIMPAWLQNVFLGYGDPAEANYRHPQQKEHLLKTIDFKVRSLPRLDLHEQVGYPKWWCSDKRQHALALRQQSWDLGSCLALLYTTGVAPQRAAA